MSGHAAFLRDRNAMLELLWELDHELRTWHANGAWNVGGNLAQRVAISEKMNQRHILAQELKGIGCAPWDFNPRHDNCWLVRPQKLP